MRPLASLVPAVVLALALAPARAHADAPEVWLARVAVAEAGWTADRDHAAVWHLLRARARARGVQLPTMVRAYSSPLRRGHWVLGAHADGRRPAFFPGGLSWGVHRGRWFELLERARVFLRGGVPDPCRGKADHFGNRSGDAARARAAGWVPVDCGGKTANLFWSVP